MGIQGEESTGTVPAMYIYEVPASRRKPTAGTNVDWHPSRKLARSLSLSGKLARRLLPRQRPLIIPDASPAPISNIAKPAQKTLRAMGGGPRALTRGESAASVRGIRHTFSPTRGKAQELTSGETVRVEGGLSAERDGCLAARANLCLVPVERLLLRELASLNLGQSGDEEGGIEHAMVDF